MIETTKRPYEFLVRWREGKITGAHVGFELTATENGKVLSTAPLPVMPVDIGQGVGFPLADILAQIHIDALISVDAANAKVEEGKTVIRGLEAEITKMKKEKS